MGNTTRVIERKECPEHGPVKIETGWNGDENCGYVMGENRVCGRDLVVVRYVPEDAGAVEALRDLRDAGLVTLPDGGEHADAANVIRALLATLGGR
jgi:hypothetical protein